MSETDSLIQDYEKGGYGSAKPGKFSIPSSRDPIIHLPSLHVAYFAALVSEMARGLLFPTMWLRVESISGSSASLGIVVASFSCGRILGAPLFGVLSEHYNYRRVLIWCNIVLIIGATVFSIAPSVLMLAIAQLLMGVGAGNLAALRAYLAETTPRINRTEYIAYLTTLQYAGFVVTPVLGALLSAAAPHLYFSFLTRYNLPALVLLLSASLCIYFLHTCFRDVSRGSSSANPTAISTERPSNTLALATEEDRALQYVVGTTGCLLNFFTKGTIAIFETLIVMYVVDVLHWTTLQAGLTISLCGIFAVALLCSFPWLLSVVDDVDLIMVGLSMMVISCLLLDSTVLPQVNNLRCYIALVLMFAVGYPVGHTALIGVFSKIIKAGPQGGFLGTFAASGSLSRIFFPAFSAWFVHTYGYNAAFSFAAVLLAVCLVYLMFHRKEIRDIVAE